MAAAKAGSDAAELMEALEDGADTQGGEVGDVSVVAEQMASVALPEGSRGGFGRHGRAGGGRRSRRACYFFIPPARTVVRTRGPALRGHS